MYFLCQSPLPDRASLPRAQGTRQRPKSPRQRLCRAPPSAKSPRKKINGKEALCRGPVVGHSAKHFPRANGGARQRKAAVNGAAPLTASLPSADSLGTRQRHFLFFFKNSLPSATAARHSAKTFFIFLKKTLCRVPSQLGTRQRFFAF